MESLCWHGDNTDASSGKYPQMKSFEYSFDKSCDDCRTDPLLISASNHLVLLDVAKLGVHDDPVAGKEQDDVHNKAAI